MGQHLPHLTKQPHWVAFEPEKFKISTEQVVREAAARPASALRIDRSKKEQTNCADGIQRPVLRDTSSEGRAHGEALKRKIQPPSTGWGFASDARKNCGIQDALLLRDNSITGIALPDATPICGTEGSQFQVNDVTRATWRPLGDDGVSPSDIAALVPPSVSDIPTLTGCVDRDDAEGRWGRAAAERVRRLGRAARRLGRAVFSVTEGRLPNTSA